MVGGVSGQGEVGVAWVFGDIVLEEGAGETDLEGVETSVGEGSLRSGGVRGWRCEGVGV